MRLLLNRLLFKTGIGVGTLAMGAPLYISEISPPEMRGSLLVMDELNIVIGGEQLRTGSNSYPIGDESFKSG